MTTFNKTTLKTFFEQGDVPTGTNYADFIDSCVNLVETAEQAMAGPLSTPELITALLSATEVNCSIFGNSLGSTTIDAANRVVINASSDDVRINAGIDLLASADGSISLICNDDFTIQSSANVVMAAPEIFIDGDDGAFTFTNDLIIDVSGQTQILCPTYVSGGILADPGIVSAAGTAQATAALLRFTVNRGKGVVDGSTTGFRPPANKAGLIQYLYNEGASANLWPPVGGTINGLAANAAFALAASAAYTIMHLTASAMAVK